MKRYELRKRGISFLAAILMLFSSMAEAVPVYAAQADAGIKTGQYSEADILAGDSQETGEDAIGSDDAGNDSVIPENLGSCSVSDDNLGDDEELISLDDTQSCMPDEASQRVHAVNMPVGVRDDETKIDSPEPLPQFITDVTQPNEPGSDDGLNSEGSAADFASAYSLVDMGYLPNNGPIDQGSSSLCWAFTSTMMAEISMIRKSLADRLSVRYSPDQTGYFFFNRINDPLGNTENDKNIIGDGLDYYNCGGNNSFNTWSLASWISMRDNSEVPFINSKYDSISDNKAYSSKAHLQNAYWTSLYSEDPRNIEYIENVKELVYNYGGVSVIVSSSMYINENHAVYNPGGGGGHNVTIVGWDDSYPKENFYQTPPGNGAWYVRDSYDNSGNRDDDGCFWLSYYSRDVSDGKSDKAIAYDFESGDNYDNNYQYDGAAGNQSLPGEESIQMANVFRAKGDEYLEAVAFAPASTSVSYEINIYKLPENFTTPVGDVSLARVTGETRYQGYRTIKLDKGVALSKDDIFSVVVDAKDTSGKNKASLFIDYSYQNSNWVTFEQSIEANQSFYYSRDLKDFGYCARIKAFTDNAGSGPGKPEKKAAALARFTEGDFYYDGTLHCPQVSINKGEDGSGEALVEGVDYTVAYYNNKYSGEATAVIYSDTYRIKNSSYTYTIKPKSMDDDVTATLSPLSFYYDGGEKKPSYTVCDDILNKELREGVDYSVSFKNNINAGIAAMVITGIGNYTGEQSHEYVILPLSIVDFDFSVPRDPEYNGSPQIPAIIVSDGSGNVLVENRDYTMRGYDNINAGTARVSVTGKGNYTGTKNLNFNILQRSIAEASIDLKSTYKYSGADIEPEPDITDPGMGGRKLEKGIDYTLEYSNNREEGNALVIIKGIGNYKGRAERTFFISAAEQLQLAIAAISDQTYIPGGIPNNPSVKVKHGRDVLNNGSDFTVSYTDNINAGTATAYITGVSRTVYDNSSASKAFTIKRFNLKKAVVDGISDRLYVSGKSYTVSPTVTVKNPVNGQPVSLKEGEDYKLTYKGNTATKKGQKVTVYIDGINNYTGRIKKTFILRDYVPMSDKESFEISLSQYEYEYDGTAKKSGVNVYYRTGNTVLTEGTDYNVTYKSNKNVGSARVIIKPSKRFSEAFNVKGAATELFIIRGKSPKDLTFDEISDRTYMGKQIKPKIVVYENGKKLSSSCFYVEYADNVNAGTGRFTVYGKNRYSGELGSGTFVIKKSPFDKVKISYKKSSDIFKVKYGNAVLRENIDFTKDASTGVITSLETNFEAGTKKYK